MDLLPKENYLIDEEPNRGNKISKKNKKKNKFQDFDDESGTYNILAFSNVKLSE